MNNIFRKVLFVGPVNEFGGIGAVLENYKKNIPEFKFIPTFSSGNNSFKILFFIKSVYRIIATLAADREIRIIHLHSASNGSFIRKSIVCLIGKLFGKKVIFHVHSGGFKDYYHRSALLGPYIKFILKISDCVVCLSGQWLEFFSSALKLNNVVIVGNPISINHCVEKKTPAEALHLLFLGKICDDKGIFDLIHALRTNHNFLNGQIRLVIAGNGEDQRLKTLLSDNVLGRYIQYEGWVQGEQKNALICACDIFILPSYMEGLPVSILEAMGSGKPVISTTVGGIPSIVKNGHNGWLIEPGAFFKLDQIFEHIFLNRDLLKKYSLNARSEAAKFSEEVILKQLSVLYSSIAENRRPTVAVQ